MSKITPWFPVTNQRDIAALGKMIEELNECAARAARCLLQGPNAIDPDLNALNSGLLAKEMADVEATFLLVRGQLKLYSMPDRTAEKLSGYFEWFRFLP